ncbi:MAG: SDR family NAD(P)-dependent oxidoreductase [Zestosphaera sp.]
MRKLFIMGASGKLMRHVVLSLASEYELILQCNRRCSELAKLLSSSLREGVRNAHLIKHDFLSEGVESLVAKMRALTNSLDASIIMEPVFDQSGFQNLSEELIKEVTYLNIVVPLTLLRALASFMRGEGSSIIVLTDLTPIKGSKVYEGLTPSLPTLASSAAIHTVLREAKNHVPSNVKVFGIALGWVNVPSKKLPEDALKKSMNLEVVVRLIKRILSECPQELNGSVIELSGYL